MRHINFDESLVMRELARIAQEQGLVKIAQEPRPMPVPSPAQSVGPDKVETTKYHPFDEQLRAFPVVGEVYHKGATKNGSGLLGELTSREFVRFVNWAKSQDVEGKQKFEALKQKLKPILGQIQAQVQKAPANFQQAYLPKLQEASGLLSSAEVEGDIVKAAEGKEYDVSGETGEDLVEQAHPGGGTKTELTHSKTNENLVETIVEQQEKDIEVAQKDPKGTYAALIELYSKLSKLGFENKLDGLKEAIKIATTPEEVVEHTLLVLADELDNLGYTKHADFVDGLLKKKIVVAENERAKQFLDALKERVGRLEGEDRHRWAVLQQLDRVSPDMPLTTVMNQTKGILDQWQQSPLYDQLYAVHTTLYNQLQDSLSQEQSELAPKQQQIRQQLGGRRVQMAPVSVKPSASGFNAPLASKGTEAVQKWQQWYNRKHKGNLREDGLWGPKTQAAYQSVKAQPQGAPQAAAQPAELPEVPQYGLKMPEFAKPSTQEVAQNLAPAYTPTKPVVGPRKI